MELRKGYNFDNTSIYIIILFRSKYLRFPFLKDDRLFLNENTHGTYSASETNISNMCKMCKRNHVNATNETQSTRALILWDTLHGYVLQIALYKQSVSL